MSLPNYHQTPNDKWFTVEKLMVGGVKGHNSNDIKASDYDFSKPQSVLAWNKAWAQYYTKQQHRGNSKHIYLKTATELRHANPTITHISYGKNGGVKTRCSPFPELDEMPPLMDWIFCGIALDISPFDSASRVEIEYRIRLTHWRQTKLHGAFGGSTGVSCGAVSVLNLIKEGYSRGLIQRRLKAQLIYAAQSHTYNLLVSDRTHDNKTYLFRNQIEIDRSIPIPSYEYIDAYVKLNVDNYLSVRKKHGKAATELLRTEEIRDNWHNPQWIEEYIEQRRRECQLTVERDKKKEQVSRKAVEEAEIIVNEFEGMMMRGVVE